MMNPNRSSAAEMTDDERETVAQDLEQWRRHGAATRDTDPALMRPLDLALAFADLAARLSAVDMVLPNIRLASSVSMSLPPVPGAEETPAYMIHVLASAVLPGLLPRQGLQFGTSGVTGSGLPVEIFDVVEPLDLGEVPEDGVSALAAVLGHLRSDRADGEALVVGCSCTRFEMRAPDEATADRAWVIHASRAVSGDDDGRHEATS